MKRDPDLAREILLRVEADEQATGPAWTNLSIEGRDSEQVSYHVQLLDEAGLLVGKDLTDHGGYEWQPIRLTAAGHDFLEAARDETRWERAKELTVKKAGTLSFEVLKYFLFKLLQDSVGGPEGS